MNRRRQLLTGFLATAVIGASAAEAASSPTVATGSATAITSSGATLNGTVNPDGSATSFHFDWGLTSAYGTSSTSRSAGSGTKSVAESLKLHGLIPGTVYHYRIVAVNRFGASAGADRRLTTAGNPPPDVATGAAQVLSPFSATATGVINPHRQATTYYFQYGLSTAYSAQTPPGTVPAGTVAQPVSASLTPLPAGKWIHYRLVAVHSGVGPEYGADASLLTFPSPAPKPRVRARTTPSRDRHRPYVFTTSGRVVGPAWIPKSLSCFENATVRFMLGRKQVASGLATVMPDCSFSLQTAFRHLPGRGRAKRQVHLTVLIHFRGNGYLAAANAKAERVTLG
jgi:hypothetical protein